MAPIQPTHGAGGFPTLDGRIKHSFDLLNEILAESPVGFAFLDADLRFQNANQMFADLVGFAIGEQQGKTLEDVVGHDLAGQMLSPIKQVLSGSGPVETELAIKPQSKTGLGSNAIIYYYPVTNADNEIVGVSALVVDITQRHVQEAESTRNAMRQARAGEQAVRMQRVTAALSQAATVSQVCDVLLTEGCAVTAAPRGAVALVRHDGSQVESVQMAGYNTVRLPTDSDLEAETPVTECIRSRQPVLVSTKAEILERFPAMEATLEQSQTQAMAVFPLVVRGRIYGAWAMTYLAQRQFEEGELIILLTLAAQGAQALERAQLYERERLIATALQRTLLPKGMPSLNGLSTATRYRPGTDGVQVGGDWYDVIRLNANRVGVVIGDVGGHNIDAAGVMGQLRNALRSYAWEHHPAGRVLELTNSLLCGLEPGIIATCCYIDLNLDDGIATLATAGHPPPLVVDKDRGAYFAQMPTGPPLGTNPEQEYMETTLFLSPGNSLALYTDGLVESRTLGVLQGMQMIAAAATEFLETREADAADDPEDLAACLVNATASKVKDDDLALLILNYRPPGRLPASSDRPKAIHRYLPSSAASAGVARRFASDVMADWGANDLVDEVGLCVSELVTNALIHTAADVELILRLSPSDVRVEVIDHSDRMPVVREGGDEETSGRGLHIVDAVATSWGVEPAASGKSVWFQIAREHA